MSIVISKYEGSSYRTTVDMRLEMCCNCGVPFAFPTDLYNCLQADSSKHFYCPNGHGQHYTKTSAQILREKLEQQQKESALQTQILKAQILDKTQEAANWQKQWETQLKAKKKVEKDLRRLNNGVCSCCNRSFSNLAEHVKNEHPELIGKEKPKRKYTKKKA